MLFSSISTLYNQLGENETLEINKKTGIVRKYHFDSKGKKHFINLGTIEHLDSQYQPVKVKPWATPPQSGKKSFSNFGNTLPKRDNTNVEANLLLGIFEMFKNNAKPGKWTDSYMRFTYDTLEVNGIKIYYANNCPRYVEYHGKKIDILQSLPKGITTK